MTPRGMVPFVQLFPQQGTAETRVFAMPGDPDAPDDEYGLLELYCAEPGCNCRRVLLNVLGRRQQTVLASVSYGFDREQEMAGPFLDPLNPQSRYANVLLQAVAQILSDPAYVARLEAHYYQVKGAVADPSRPMPARPRISAVPTRRQTPRSRPKRRKRRGR